MRRARPLWSVVMSLSASLLASALAHAALPADPSRVPVITGRPPIPAALGGPAGNAAAAPMGVEFLVDTSSTRIRFDVGRRLHSDGVNYAPALVAAVVDLDHDAWPEVVSTSPACAALTIHSDVAADEAERVSTLALPGAAFGLATGDVDGDGNTDVAVTLWDTARLAVLRGNGNGTFQAPNTAVLGPDPRGVTLADLDGDAVLDAAVACAGDNTVRTFHGRGDGAFDSTGTYGVGESPLQVIAADLDGDGRRDLVSVDATGRTLSCLMNLGGGAFAPATRFGLPGSTLSGDRAFAAAAGDLDGDGAVDLAVSTSWGGLLMMGDGKGGLVPSDAITTKGDAFDGGVAIADLDGDGRPDVLLGGPNHADLTSSGSVVRFALVHVFRGLGGGAFERVAGYHACYYQQSITVGDLDLDGRPDVLSAGTDTYWPRERATGLSVLMNRGGGRLGEVIELGLPDPAAAGAQYQPGPGARALHLDGPLDDLLATRGDRTFLFVNRGARGFAEPVDLGAGDFTVAGDLDGDGRDDVLWRAGNTCSLLRGLAGHALDAPRPVLDGVALLTIGRLDADAAPDAVVLGADGRVAIDHGQAPCHHRRLGRGVAVHTTAAVSGGRAGLE